jgi:spore coat protein U-like protein
MRTFWARLAAVLLLVCSWPAAHATITCTSISSPGVSVGYVNNSTTSLQTYFVVSCTRSSVSDPLSVSYDVAANNGLNPNGVNNRAFLGSASLRYDVFTNSSCGTAWKNPRNISDSITWPNGATGTITKQTTYWGCIVTAQTATATGTYTDSVTMTMTYGPTNTTVVGTIPVSIYAPALCTVTTRPGALSLGYQAFGPQVSQSTNFGLTCTSGMPYTIATDVPEAVLTGLRYTLGLSATSASGTGAPQTYSVTATIPAGQAGSCPSAACTGSRIHTLTITY